MNAYDRAMAQKLADQQRKQRETTPKKVAQKLLQEWLGRRGFGGLIDPFAGADLVRMVEAIIVAERAASIEPQVKVAHGGAASKPETLMPNPKGDSNG